jgi:hypothetical protein
VSGAEPLISIVVPAWNRAALIGETLRSIASDGSIDFEVVVVDDGSSDDTAAVAARVMAEAGLPGRILRQANAGPGAARNAGARHACGRWLAFLDSDDRWLPWTLPLLARCAQEAEEPTLFFLQHVDFLEPASLTDVEAEPLRLESHETFADAAARTSVPGAEPIRFGAYMVTREAFLALGGFSHEIRCSEDLDLFLRGDGTWRCVLIRRPKMIGYRLDSGNNLSADPTLLLEGLRHMRRNEADTVYCDDPRVRALRLRLYAQSAAFTAKVAFARGLTMLAYRVLASHADLIWRHGRRRWLAALPLTPALSLIKPADYPFRLRRRRRQ